MPIHSIFKNRWTSRTQVIIARDSKNRNEPHPILFFDSFEVKSATQWMIERLNERKLMTKVQALKAVGLFFEYYLASGKAIESFQHLKAILQSYYNARLSGTIRRDEGFTDIHALYWTPVSLRTVNNEVDNIERYLTYCVTKNTVISGTCEKERYLLLAITSAHRKARSFNRSLSAQYGFKSHLKNNYETLKRDRELCIYEDFIPFEGLIDRNRGRTSNVSFSEKKRFLQNNVLDMITSGCRVSRDLNKPFYKQYNVRDMLLFSMYLLGGLRLGEPLHLWTRDIQLNSNGDCLNVYLCHPELSPNVFEGRLMTRDEYLFSQYGLRPRTLRLGEATYVGWKDLAYHDEYGKFAMLIWLAPPVLKKLLVKLHEIYVTTIRPEYMSRSKYNHPYYFVTEEGREMTYHGVRKQWSLAANRIGLRGQRCAGENIHSARHNYAMSLEEMGFDNHVIQSALHHKSPFSQNVYKKPSISSITEKISEAFERIEKGELGAVHIKAEDVRSKIDPQNRFLCWMEMN